TCALRTQRRRSPLHSPYTTLFRSCSIWTPNTRTSCPSKKCSSTSTAFPPERRSSHEARAAGQRHPRHTGKRPPRRGCPAARASRSEEHTSELQSRENLVCRLLLEK